MTQSSKRASIFLGWLVCLLGALFYCYEYLLRIEPSVMIPELMHHFAVTASGMGLLAALYYYAYTPMQLLVGILIDRYGSRLVITIAVLFCALGSFLFSTVDSIYLAAFGRFLIGFGSAFAFVGVLKLAAVWLPKRHFALFVGFATALGMVGAMVGDVELSALVYQIGWRDTLYIGTVLGVILAPLFFLMVRNAPKSRSGVENNAIASYRETFIGLWQIVKNSQMWLAGIIGCTMFLSLSVVAELWAVPFLRASYRLPAHSAAFVCAFVFLGWLVGGPLMGWLSDKVRNRRLPLVIGGLLAAGVITLVLYRPIMFSAPVLSLLMFLFGFFCSAEIICLAISRENNPTHIAATAVAFTNLLVMLGGMLFQPLVGKLLDQRWDGLMQHGIRAYSASDYQHALWLVPIAILIGAALTLLLQETADRDGWDEF